MAVRCRAQPLLVAGITGNPSAQRRVTGPLLAGGRRKTRRVIFLATKFEVKDHAMKCVIAESRKVYGLYNTLLVAAPGFAKPMTYMLRSRRTRSSIGGWVLKRLLRKLACSFNGFEM